MDHAARRRTIEVGFGALTGRPLALTGARVPAASALRCSRWICGLSACLCLWMERGERALSFLEIGMVVVVVVSGGGVDAEFCSG